jgi:hypothetical protein
MAGFQPISLRRWTALCVVVSGGRGQNPPRNGKTEAPALSQAAMIRSNGELDPGEVRD